MSEEKPSDGFDHYFSEKPVGKYNARKISAYVRGRSYFFETASGIFSYKALDKGTEILLKYLDFPAEGNILDLGAGYGAIGIVVAKELEHNDKINFYFSEINKRAVWVLKRNIRNNNIKNFRVLSGDFIDRAKELQEEGIKFKAIYTNPPNRIGLDRLFELLHCAIGFLDDNGFLQYVIKKSYGAESFSSRMLEEFPGHDVFCTAVKSGYRVYTVVSKGMFSKLFPNIINLNADDEDEQPYEEILDDDGIDFSKEYPEPDAELTEKFNYAISGEDTTDEDPEVGFETKFSSYEYRSTSKTKKKLKRKKKIRLDKEGSDQNDEDFDEELDMGEEMSMKEEQENEPSKKIVFGSPFRLDNLD